MVNERLVAPAIVEALEKEGALELEDLLKSVQKIHGDLDRGPFEDILMDLEIQGLIKVYSMTRDKRRVELVRG